MSENIHDERVRALTAFYKMILLRDADAPGLDQFVSRLDAGSSGYEEVLGTFFTGPEFGVMHKRFIEHYVGSIPSQPPRPIGNEISKSFTQKEASGFFRKYIKGPNVLDIGYKGGREDVEPVLPGAIGVDIDYPGYDGVRLPFSDESQDAVFASHTLEHIPDYIAVIRDWHRVLKIGGHMIIMVPDAFLYERKAKPPSRWASDHRRFYTPSSLLREIEDALNPNSYRVRHLAENDMGYQYQIPPDTHAVGCYEIELVLEKIKLPEWRLRDS